LKYYIAIIILIFSTLLHAQQLNDDVDYEYDRAYLEKLIEEQINAYREYKKLPSFKQDNILTSAAEDQSLYILRSGKVSHNQPSSKKETPFNRVMFYDGMHGKVGENCFKIVVGSFLKLPGEEKKTKIKSYNNVATAIAQGWVQSPEGKLIIGNAKYVNSGIAVIFNEKEKTIVATHVVGSEPFVLPEGVKPMKGEFGIEPFNNSKCSSMESKYSYLPQLMTDNIFFKNGEIYFYFHDLELFNNVLSESRDGIAIDIISRDQFSCQTGNKFYPSNIHSGILLPPIFKSQIFGKNELKESNELEVSLGPIPSYVDTNNVEFNLLIIKDNCLCQTIVYNSLGGENLQSLDLKLLMDTLSVSNQIDSVMNQFSFTIPFERNKSQYNSDDIKPFLDSLSLKRFDLKKIEVIAYSSLDGGIEGNKIIQQKRANSILNVIQKYKLQNVETEIVTKENWEGFYESIKGSPYEKELLKYSKEELRKIINSDTLKYNLEPYLESQREAKIILTVEKIFMDSALFKVLPQRFNVAIKRKDYTKAKVYQSVMLKNISNGKINIAEVLNVKIPHFKETVPFINNQIALRWYTSSTLNKDSLHNYMIGDIATQLLVDPTNSYLLYNKIVLRLLLWSNNYKREADPKLVLREIKQLINTNIEKRMINRLLLNYNIISADYYYENKKFKEREKSLDEVQKALLSSDLDRNHTFKIANYFMFQMRIKWAIDIMKPLAIKKSIDEEFLFTFLTLAIYDKEKVPEIEYLDIMKRAKEMNKERFCELFGFPNMSFQLLKNLSVKEMYCKTCNE
jgi:uncharacterized protein YkwD